MLLVLCHGWSWSAGAAKSLNAGVSEYPMKIGNYLNLINSQKNDSSSNRLDRLEKRRDRWDQTFDSLQQQAIKEGDSEKAQKIFEMSEMMEEKLDARLDVLEEKTGEFNWNRHLDNAFDKLQANAYTNDDTEMAENIFSLSQVIKGGKFDSSKQSLLQKFLAGSTSTSTSTSTLASLSSSDLSLNNLIKAATQSSSTTGTTSSTTGTTSSTTGTTSSTTGTNNSVLGTNSSTTG
jgi:hypothetical protein